MSRLQYAQDALQILKTSVELAEAGHPEFYRVAALQLRMLFCDSNRVHGEIVDLSLIPALFPEQGLYPLMSDGSIDESAVVLPLKQWLNQPIPVREGISIPLRTLIRRVVDRDGGAHVDWKQEVDPSDAQDYARWILSISKAVLSAFSPF